MKRTILIAGGLAALVAIYVGNQLAAQPSAQPGTSASMRIAFINIETVLQNYKKAQTYKSEMEKELSPFKLKAEELKRNILGWQKALEDPKLPQAEKEKGENSIVIYKRQLEDLQRQVGKLYEQKTKQQIEQIYKEVDDAVKRYAQGHAIHAVFGFGDNPQVSPLDISNIMRKIQGMDRTGCVAPLYYDRQLDISAAIAEALNQGLATAGTAASPSGITPASGSR